MTIISKGLLKLNLGIGVLVKRNFNKDTQKAYKVNESVLLKILRKNYKSEIGIKYNFKSINSIRDFRDKFPITNYDFYEKYIEKMAKGYENILFSEKIEYFGHTSGTTGKQKLIPTTKSSRLIGSKYMAILLNRFAYDNLKDVWNCERGLTISDIVTTNYTEGGIPICSATSGGMKGIKNIIKYFYTSPIEVMEIKDKDSANYLHLLFALNERNLSNISAAFISNILDLFRILEDNYKDLVADIRKGRINRKIKLDEETRKKLNGYNPYVEKIRYVVIPDTVFYEFIPFEEIYKDNPKTLLINELKVGERYEVVITNYAGLYRYRLGDVVKVVDYYNNSPEIEFLFRKNQVLNMVAEKTNEEQLTSAIKKCMSSLNLNLVDFTTIPDNSITPGRYVFYCEFKEKIESKDIKILEKQLDKELKKSNLAYDRARNNKKLGNIKIVILKSGTFKIIKESLFKKGVSKNQIKIPRVVINNENILRIINEYKIKSKK